jgi:hypothetical protein
MLASPSEREGAVCVTGGRRERGLARDGMSGCVGSHGLESPEEHIFCQRDKYEHSGDRTLCESAPHAANGKYSLRVGRASRRDAKFWRAGLVQVESGRSMASGSECSGTSGKAGMSGWQLPLVLPAVTARVDFCNSKRAGKKMI